MISIEIQTAGWIGMKFGTEVVLKCGVVLCFFDLVAPTPQVQGAKRGSGVPLEPQLIILVKTLQNKSCRAPLI